VEFEIEDMGVITVVVLAASIVDLGFGLLATLVSD
jgi:hypothetical protein